MFENNDQLNKLRAADRISSREIINSLMTNFVELAGDRISSDDQSILAGAGMFNDQPIEVIGVQRDGGLQQRIARNFGSVRTAGYRKATRLIKQAEKFNRPIVTLINMLGADASKAAEQENIAAAIGETMLTLGRANVPTIAVILGEGHSGGALALVNTDKLIMLSDAIFNVASPESVNAILKQPLDSPIAGRYQIQSAQQLFNLKLVDQVVEYQDDKQHLIIQIGQAISEQLKLIDPNNHLLQREQKQNNFLRQWLNLSQNLN